MTRCMYRKVSIVAPPIWIAIPFVGNQKPELIFLASRYTARSRAHDRTDLQSKWAVWHTRSLLYMGRCWPLMFLLYTFKKKDALQGIETLRFPQVLEPLALYENLSWYTQWMEFITFLQVFDAFALQGIETLRFPQVLEPLALYENLSWYTQWMEFISFL